MKAIEAPKYFIFEESYTGNHEYFYNSDEYPEIKELEAHWQVIAQEVLGIITDSELRKMSNINPPHLSNPNAWRNIYFYNFGWQTHKNCNRFPLTFALISKIPNLILCGVTVLEPNSKVLPHNGETNTTIRCHLGLKIPAPYPTCGVRVGNKERGWKEGRTLMFSDAHYHTTWNDSNEKRYILVFDIVRKEYAEKRHSICANSLGALTLKYLYSLNPKIKNLPPFIIKIAHKCFTIFWYLYLPVQQKFRLP